jgi:hypothetical protein
MNKILDASRKQISALPLTSACLLTRAVPEVADDADWTWYG